MSKTQALEDLLREAGGKIVDVTTQITARIEPAKDSGLFLIVERPDDNTCNEWLEKQSQEQMKGSL